MAKGSSFRVAVKLIKASNRAATQSARQADRNRAKRQREYERQVRESEREAARLDHEYEKQELKAERDAVKQTKEQFKKALENASSAYELRCLKRKEVRVSIINEELK
jgi:predicted RNase H-like nuclease (RuvC/YqgF family)